MKRTILLTMLMVLTLGISRAVGVESMRFENETLKYVVTYKWGLIQKDSGSAIVRLTNRGDNYDITMTARTHPWADKIFKVRDTLRCVIKRDGFRPVSYRKSAFEGGKFSLDEVKYNYSGSEVIGNVQRVRDRDGKLVGSDAVLRATGPTFDFLSIFYYLRLLDYSQLKASQVFKATVFSGSAAETLTIRVRGKEKVKMRDKSEREAWHITFRFTRGGGKKSSDDIDAWISVTQPHVPLLLEGKLPIGKIKVLLEP